MTNASFPPRTITIDALGFPFPARDLLERWHKGRVSCLNACVTIWGDTRQTLTLVGRWHRLLEENADIAALATSTSEIARIAASGRVAVVLGFQNTAPIEHDIELFRVFRKLGVCIMQLTYNLQNYIGSGCWEERDSGISSQFGRKAIAEMNALGILVDLSHCGDRTTLEAIDLSARPVAITHGNPREFVGTSGFGTHRLRSTEALRALALRGGVVGLSPNPHMLKNREATTLSEFCDMVHWTIDLIGIDHIGIGSDYCPGHPPGTRRNWRYGLWSRDEIQQVIAEPGEAWQDWMTTAADFQVLREGMEASGLASGDVDAIMGGNFLRLFDQVFTPDCPVPAGMPAVATTTSNH
jgi:microsomal dipeptidase-like Zn-dependent dipeptidase